MRQLGQPRKDAFEDSYIHNILTSAKLPFAEFKQSPGAMFFFYEDLALTLLAKLALKTLSPMTREKLQQEFYIVAMLNVLYGNPNIHLI